MANQIKIACFNFKAKSYLVLTQLIDSVASKRSYGGHRSNLLLIPSHKLSFRARGFRAVASTAWNFHPPDINSITRLTPFRRRL